MENTKLSSADLRLRRVKNALECVKESVWKCLSEKAGLETGAVEHNARNARNPSGRQPETGARDGLLAEYAGSVRQLADAGATIS